MHFPNDTFIINTAFTGAVSSKARNPHVPYTPAEVCADAIACAGQGTSVGHFHVRTDNGDPTNDPDAYARLFATLREQEALRQLVIVASTSGRHGQSLQQRMDVLNLSRDVRPDMASLTLSSLNFASGPSINSPDDIRHIAETMQRQEVRPELEIFDLGMVSFAHQLIHEGLLTPPFYVNVILGNQAGMMPTLTALAALISDLPDGALVSLGGIARHQLTAHRFALAMADGVRTGLEDNLLMDGTGTLATNPTLTARAAGMARASGRTIATAPEVRHLLNLTPR